MKRVNKYESVPEVNAVRELLAEGNHEVITVENIEEDTFVLASNAYVDTLDHERVKEETVVRCQSAYGSKNSTLAFSEHITGFLAVKSDENVKRLILEVMKDVLTDYGLAVFFDGSSNQANDLVVNGKKVAAAVQTEDYGYTLGMFIISVSNDYSMLKKLNLPDSKFEGKESSSPEERATALDEHIDLEDLDIDQLCQDIEEEIASRLGKQLEEYTVSEELDKKVQERADYLTSEEFINERQPR